MSSPVVARKVLSFSDGPMAPSPLSPWHRLQFLAKSSFPAATAAA